MTGISEGLLEEADREICLLRRENSSLELKIERKNRETDRLYRRIAMLESSLELADGENRKLRKKNNTGALVTMESIDSEKRGSALAEENVREILDRISRWEETNVGPECLEERSADMCRDFTTIRERMRNLSNDYAKQKAVVKALINDTEALSESYGRLSKTKLKEFIGERRRIRGERKLLRARKKELEKEYERLGRLVADLDSIGESVNQNGLRYTACVGKTGTEGEVRKEPSCLESPDDTSIEKVILMGDRYSTPDMIHTDDLDTSIDNDSFAVPPMPDDAETGEPDYLNAEESGTAEPETEAEESSASDDFYFSMSASGAGLTEKLSGTGDDFSDPEDSTEEAPEKPEPVTPLRRTRKRR